MSVRNGPVVDHSEAASLGACSSEADLDKIKMVGANAMP
jgi:hypothetical protein